ncbi:signal peptidase II [Cohnella yongneupensis]|uniref:Lipoprotein signal peptidase n=1 Tax=Cohnella yongneupensis TaxID=425006 RepID=A0ABW0QTY1_9BACL
MYFYLFIVLALCIDQATKIAIRANVALGEKKELWGFIRLTHLENTGSSGNMLHGQGRLLAILILTLAGIALYLKSRGRFRGTLTQVGVALFIGGGIGNALDRILYNQVTDFLYFADAATMNFADIWVFLAFVCIVASQFKPLFKPNAAGLEDKRHT